MNSPHLDALLEAARALDHTSNAIRGIVAAAQREETPLVYVDVRAARAMGIPARTFARARHALGPIKLGRTKVVRRADLIAWIETQPETHTAQPPPAPADAFAAACRAPRTRRNRAA